MSLTRELPAHDESGRLQYLITNPRDIPGLVMEMRKHSSTMFTGVTHCSNALMITPISRKSISPTAGRSGGGMAVQKAVADRWKKMTGCTLVEAYGLSETSPAVTIKSAGSQGL